MLSVQADYESVVQINDKTRIDISKSFVTADEEAIEIWEVKPSTADDYVDVTDTMYLDWAYDSAGSKTVTARVTAGETVATKDLTITVLSVADDNLFSSDLELRVHEHDISQWLPSGRSTWNHMHRRAQSLILDYLDREGKVDSYGDKYTKEDFIDVQEAKEWSTFMTLRMVMESISNSVDDVFAKKAKLYESREIASRNRLVLRIDTDADGELSDGEQIEGPRTARLVRY